jgi:hypothetical protein
MANREWMHLGDKCKLTYAPDAKSPWQVWWHDGSTMMDDHRTLASVLHYEYDGLEVSDRLVREMLAMADRALTTEAA